MRYRLRALDTEREQALCQEHSLIVLIRHGRGGPEVVRLDRDQLASRLAHGSFDVHWSDEPAVPGSSSVPIPPALLKLPPGGLSLDRLWSRAMEICRHADIAREQLPPDRTLRKLGLAPSAVNDRSSRRWQTTLFSRPGVFRKQQWYVFDVDGIALGRAASLIAVMLMGKHRPTYTPHVDYGDFVVVVNAERVSLGGRPNRTRSSYSGYPGGHRAVRYSDLRACNPAALVEIAVRRMIPKSRLGRQMMKKLRVYAGPEHPHGGQRPIVLGSGVFVRNGLGWSFIADSDVSLAGAPPCRPAITSAPPSMRQGSAKSGSADGRARPESTP